MTTSGQRRARVLVIDDEVMIGRAVQRALGTEHDVTVCDRGREALDLIVAGQRFDVILCDLVMPEMTGVDFRAELHAFAPEMASTIVFMTAGAFNPMIDEILDDIPNERVDKPFDATHLRNLVRSRLT